MLRFPFLLAAAPLVAQIQVQTPPVIADPAPAATSTPTPAPSPTPTSEPAPVASPDSAATPTPVPTPRPEASAEPAPEPLPTPEPAPTEAPLPIPDPAATPAPPADLPANLPANPPGAVTTTVADDTRTADGGGGWLLWAGIALVILAVAIVGRLLLPRRRTRVIEEEPVAATPDPAAISPVRPTPTPASAPAAAPTPSPVAPAIDFRPARIGLNLVSVTASGEIMVRNDAPVAMHDLRVRASLLAAAAGHEDAVAGLHRAPAGRLAVPPFALAPGEARAIRLIAAAPRSEIEPLEVGGRPMMVPLVAITVDWRDEAGEHRRTQAFAVGVERVDSAKLAPVWLDQDSRSFDAVAARPHGRVIG